MVISDSKRFVFLHNPKAAGTSIRRALLAKYDTRGNFFWGPIEGGSLKRRIDKAHMALEDARVIFPGDYVLLDDYFVFAFVRNPYERYVSSFAEYLKHHRKDINIVTLDPAEILAMIHDFTRAEIHERRVRYNYKFRHFIPQHLIIYYGHKCRADYIARVDDIEREFSNIMNLLDLDVETKVGEANKQARKLGTLHHDLSEDVRDVVKRVYEKDFLYFDFDPRE